MTYSELKKKDIICMGDGRVLGRVGDLEFDAGSGQIRALMVACPTCFSAIFHGERDHLTLPWQQIACIGDDVILVSTPVCRS